MIPRLDATFVVIWFAIRFGIPASSQGLEASWAVGAHEVFESWVIWVVEGSFGGFSAEVAFLFVNHRRARSLVACSAFATSRSR